jgi:hypothetical protein
LIGVNLLGALLLGMLMGYERSYNGRASAMRTYGLALHFSCPPGARALSIGRSAPVQHCPVEELKRLGPYLLGKAVNL